MITIDKKELNKSVLKRIVKCHDYSRKIAYDYDLYEIYKENVLYPIGYILKYDVIGLKGTKDNAYIDIFIRPKYRNHGYGTEALNLFINHIIKKNKVMIITENRSKIKFLLKNGFIKDKIYIYKNLYKYQRGDISE